MKDWTREAVTEMVAKTNLDVTTALNLAFKVSKDNDVKVVILVALHEIERLRKGCGEALEAGDTATPREAFAKRASMDRSVK